MLDELVDGVANRALRIHVAAVLDPELVSPNRHRSRAMRAFVDAAAVDDVANQHRRKLAVASADRRQVRNGDVERRGNRAVTVRFAAMATRAEAIENAAEAIEGWLETAKEVGLAIPEPRYRPAIYAARDAA